MMNDNLPEPNSNGNGRHALEVRVFTKRSYVNGCVRRQMEENKREAKTYCDKNFIKHSGVVVSGLNGGDKTCAAA